MKQFQSHRGDTLSYFDEGAGAPVVMVHGFASNAHVNWVNPGWFKVLGDAGYRTIALDNLGHGQSDKSENADDYTPQAMAGDVIALLDHLGLSRVHLMGYSMGARISAYLTLAHPDRVASLTMGGLGMALIEGAGDWDPVVEALRAEDPSTITNAQGKMFRAFADQTKSDRLALAACIEGSRANMPASDVARMITPTLVGVGTKDDIAGSADQLAALLPHGQALNIERRDHMLAVGDASFKKAMLAFIAEHPIDS